MLCTYRSLLCKQKIKMINIDCLDKGSNNFAKYFYVRREFNKSKVVFMHPLTKRNIDINYS